MPTSSISELKARLAALQEEWREVNDQLERETGLPSDHGGLEASRLEAAPEVRILDNAADGIFTLDGEGCLRYINLAGLRMLASKGEDLIGTQLMKMLAPRANRRLIAEVGQWLKEPLESKTFLMVDMPVMNRFGEKRWLSLHLQRESDAEGNITEIQGIARDITEQHRLQLALRRSEEHYRGIIENMELGILEVDNEERIIRAFPKFCAIVGYSEEELLGRKASEVFMRAEDALKMDARTADRNAGESGLYECVVRKKNGEDVWLLISGIPIRDEHGEVVGSMGIHYDISARKKDEQELESALRDVEAARRSERVFLAKMSHEIRTPMNAIIGMSHLLEATHLNEEQQAFVGAISKGGELLKGLLDDILDLARLEDGQLSLNPRTTYVKPLFEGVVKVYGMMMAEKGVDLTLSWDGTLDVPIGVDRSALSQVLLNLVGNAAKFTEKGRVVIRPTLRLGQDSDVMEVAVEDTGIGIPAHAIDRIFDRFQQSDQPKSGGGGGSGLGLSIVRELCTLHGGRVFVESEVGTGSVFTFSFVVDVVQGQHIENKGLDVAALKGRKVLIAEDNAVNALYLCKLLSRWEMEYTAVEDGEKAVEAWKKGSYDLILMDIQMPMCDGMEATRIIRSAESTVHSRTPIIGLSAFAFHEDVVDGLASGMDGYLKKPYSPDELAGAINAWL